MKARRNQAGWPENLTECTRCHAVNGSTRYGARGLCMRCYMSRVREGEIRVWRLPDAEPMETDPAERARIAATRKANPARRLVRLVGATHAATMCSVDVAIMRVWFEAGTPSDVCETVETELQRVRRERARRAALGYGGRGDDPE